MSVIRREFALVLLLGAAAAWLVLPAVRPGFAPANFNPPRALPPPGVAVTRPGLRPPARAPSQAALRRAGLALARPGGGAGPLGCTGGRGGGPGGGWGGRSPATPGGLGAGRPPGPRRPPRANTAPRRCGSR